MKALVCPSIGQPLQLQTVPVPKPTHGSVVVKVLYTAADPTLPNILNGKAGFTNPDNFVPGGRAVARVVARGPDTTTLQDNQLVLLDPFVRARDDPGVKILWGTFDGGSPVARKFTADNWAYAAYAEYCRAPLENVHPLDEKVLCGSPAEGGLGYSHADLLHLTHQLVAYGGLRGINLQPGETVIVAPATGKFSGSAIQVAVAMGAKVIAFSRNKKVMEETVASFPAGRVKVVLNTGDVEKDTAALKQFGEVDAYIDVSPHAAAESTHIASAIKALKPHGRVSLMGVIPKELPVSYMHIMWNSLTIQGQYMYEWEDVRLLIKMAESGVLPLGKKGGVEVLGKFALEDYEKAIELAVAHPEIGKAVVFEP
jgi:D-arabinose 1-dehydrogenase-like Zn-dependent alcohol dehydrogenase